MSIYEYNEEYARKSFFEEGQEDGYERGIAVGKLEGRAEVLVEIIDNLMNSLNIDMKKACESIGSSIEEYTRACEMMSCIENNNL